MFSYRHGFHAGNHADVLKHMALLHVVNYLTEKGAPLRRVFAGGHLRAEKR